MAGLTCRAFAQYARRPRLATGAALDPWSARVQHTQSFDLTDASGNKIDGYNTVDFIGSYLLPVGKLSFSIVNLKDKDYTTVWGQRAPLLYNPTYGH